MTSKVLDLTTVAHALNELCDAFLGEAEWQAADEVQHQFLVWYAANREVVRKLDSLEALASTDYVELNTFLTDRRFDPRFEQFTGIGVVAVLDMLVEWVSEGRVTELERQGGEYYYPAFRLSTESAEVYDVVGFEHPLVRLLTKTGHSLWLMKSGEPATGMDLVWATMAMLSAPRQLSTAAGAIVPMLEMDLEADLSWMLGLKALSTGGEYGLRAAFQQFKLRANDRGARVKVATGMVVATAACAPRPMPYLLDDPFIGFFTQPDNETMPLAAFWADTDVWRSPTGTLEEL